MNVKQTPDPEHSEPSDLELDVVLDEVPDAVQQGTALVGGGVDAAKAYVPPTSLPARIDSKPPPAVEGRVAIADRVDPRRMPTVKISARDLAAGAIPGWRPGGPAPGATPTPSPLGSQPDWATPPPGSWPSPGSAGPSPASQPWPAPAPRAISGALWIFALVLAACAIVALGAVLWVEFSRSKSAPAAASSSQAPAPSGLTGPSNPEAAPVPSAAPGASTRSGTRGTIVTPKPSSPARR
jgi:hypothetical protein